MKTYLALALLIGGLAHGVEFNDATLALLKSPRPTDRARFYALLPGLPLDQQRLAVDQLKEAREFWREPITRQVLLVSGRQNDWSAFLKVHGEWRASVGPLMTNIRTDFHKDPQKVKELTREFEQCAKFRDRARRAVGPAERGEFARLLAACQTLHEIEKWIDNPSGAAIPFRATLQDTLIKALSDLPDDLAKVKAIRDFNAMEKRLVDAETWNASCRWAKPEQVRFASILNRARHVVDLPPLRLEEKLCQASSDHSTEMVALKYFAHDSPTLELKTFGDRAKKAGFDGFASGECIFAGSASAEAAYGGWWASDGHRHIMYMDGVNTIGIGTGGTNHWTFNPGSRSWPVPAP